MAKTTKANSPGTGEEERRLDRHRRLDPHDAAPRRRPTTAFDDDQRRHRGQVGERVRQKRNDVDAHPDRHEEEAEEQPLERLDIDLELMPVLALAEEQPGEERAERRGQPGRRR